MDRDLAVWRCRSALERDLEGRRHPSKRDHQQPTIALMARSSRGFWAESGVTAPRLAFLASVEAAPVPSHTVEHSCYQCGASVEDGIPFCRQCNAPQIRVPSAEILAPVEIVPEGLSPYQAAPLRLAGFDWAHALRAAALAGLLGVLLIIVLRQAFALAMVSSGFLAVYFYRRKNPFFKPAAGTGALLGALSGIFGTALLAIPCGFAIFSVRSGGENRAEIIAALREQIMHNPDPRTQQLLEYLKTPEGFTFIVIVLLVMMLIFFLVLSSLGGAIAAALLRRSRRL